MPLRMPVLRSRDAPAILRKKRRQSIKRRYYPIALIHSERSAWAKIILYVNNQ
jgi:hypothetical protein